MILITGATGSNGAEILKILAARGIPVRALVRDRSCTAAIQSQNVDIVEGDFDRPETLLAALNGVERAFLLTSSSERAESQQLAFVEAARRSSVAHLVKLSQFHADKASPVRFLRYHAVVEEAIRASGMAYTFLRPNLFMQSLLGFRDTIKDQGNFYAAAGDASVSVVDVRDIAAVAVAALTKPGHEGKIYDLTGPQALTHAGMAQHLSVALKRTISFVDVPPTAMRDALAKMGMPPWQAEGLIEDYAHYRRGEAAIIAGGVREAIGTQPRDFATFAQDYAIFFS